MKDDSVNKQCLPKIITFALLTFCLSNFAQAQPATALIEACNALTDAQKRLECMKAAFASTQTKDDDKTQSLVNAFTGFWGRVEAGSSLINYQSALSNLAQEFAVFKNSSPAPEQETIEAFEKSLEAYRDAGEFWQKSISFYARRDNRISYGGGLPVNMVGIGWMLSKYELPATRADVWGIQIGVPTELGRSQILKKAKEFSDKGIELLKKQSAKN